MVRPHFHQIQLLAYRPDASQVVIMCDSQLLRVTPNSKDVVRGEKMLRVIPNVHEILNNRPFRGLHRFPPSYILRTD